MVIHDFYVVSITIDPLEANPPLVIDANTVLPRPVAAEPLQPVRWRDAKTVQCDSSVAHAQLAIAGLLDALGQPGRSLAGEDAGGFLALGGFDHVLGKII
jgi:hypothetical protein